MLAAILIAIRDVLLAAALAWVGVSLEAREPAASCANDACQQQSE